MEEHQNESGLRWLWWLVLAIAFYFICPAIWVWPIFRVYGDSPPEWVQVIGFPAQWLYDLWPVYEAWVDWSMTKTGLK